MVSLLVFHASFELNIPFFGLLGVAHGLHPGDELGCRHDLQTAARARYRRDEHHHHLAADPAGYGPQIQAFKSSFGP